MFEKANETLVEWLESKDKWNKSCVNILNIGHLEEIVNGEEVVIKLKVTVKQYLALEFSWTS